MEAIYNQLGSWDDATYAALWKQWLWESDPNARPLDACHDMNHMHVLGVLICLGEVSRASQVLFTEPWTADVIPAPSVVFLHPMTPVADLTVRELMDQLECLQLNWGPTLAALGPAMARNCLRALMARLGDIAHHAYPVNEEGCGEVLDDPQHTTSVTTQLSVISRSSLRRAVCIFFALLRVCDIVEQAREVPEQGERDVDRIHGALRQHHTESSIDLFNQLQQMMYLAPGQRLAYRTHFAGQYNDVSQVVFYHHERYQRKAQIELAKIPDEPMHMLPLISQLLPELALVYDDDDGAPLPKSGADWAWLVCCGAIFLVQRTPAGYEIWSSPKLGPLVSYYLQTTGKSILGVSDEDDEEEEAPAAAAAAAAVVTSSSHIVLL
jgi:hypothetical protein